MTREEPRHIGVVEAKSRQSYNSDRVVSEVKGQMSL